MAWEVALACDRCGRGYRLCTHEFRFYAIPWQPAAVPLWDRVACVGRDGWCHRCGRPRAIELLPALEWLEARRAVLAVQGGTDELARAEAAIRWRRGRSSPPRCLCCGSAAVEPMDETFRHPGCGGRFAVAGTPWHHNTSVAFEVPAEGPAERGRLWTWWSRLTAFFCDPPRLRENTSDDNACVPRAPLRL